MVFTGNKQRIKVNKGYNKIHKIRLQTMTGVTRDAARQLNELKGAAIVCCRGGSCASYDNDRL